MRAGIALGSNLGDRLENLRGARDQVCAIAGVVAPILQSAIYETAPVGCEPDAANFYNAVIELGFKKSVEALFAALRKIEIALGRARDKRRNVSRTLDLDLLYFGETTRHEPGLQLPHPRITAREFVLRPLAEIRPDLKLPGETASVHDLLVGLPPGESVKLLRQKW